MELLLVFISLIFSFFFAGFETGFISLDYLNVLYIAKIEKNRSFERILKLFNKKEFIISILLVGNNIAVISATIFYNLFLFKLLNGVGNREILMPIITISTLTPIFFFFGELLPKSLFKTYPYLMVQKTYFLFLIIYTILYVPGFIFYVISKIVVKIINLIFKNSNSTDKYFIQNSLNTISSNLNSNTINDLVENKTKNRKFFKPIFKNMIYESSLKIKNIPRNQLQNSPIFISKKNRIVGVISDYKHINKTETKLQLLYKRVTFYNDFEDVDITNLNTDFIVIQKDNQLFYTSKELILKIILGIHS